MPEEVRSERIEEPESSGLLLSIEPLEGEQTLHASPGDGKDSDTDGTDTGGDGSSDTDGTDMGDTDGTDAADTDGTDTLTDTDGTDTGTDADGTDASGDSDGRD